MKTTAAETVAATIDLEKAAGEQASPPCREQATGPIYHLLACYPMGGGAGRSGLAPIADRDGVPLSRQQPSKFLHGHARLADDGPKRALRDVLGEVHRYRKHAPVCGAIRVR
jgi:hypothetical protein